MSQMAVDARGTAAISACEKNAQPEQALELLREIERQSAKSDVISYTSTSSARVKGA